MPQTPEEIKACELANEEIGAAVTYLLHTVAKHKAMVAGFVWGVTPPVFTNFGNCNDCCTHTLFDELVTMADERRNRGMCVKTHVPRPS